MEWVAFVRNVMVGREGPHRARLLDLAHDAGAEDVRSYITTGNLSFRADDDADGLAQRLEAGVAAVLGRPELVALRPLPWLAELVARDPFGDLAPGEWATEVALLRHDAPALEPERLPDPQRTVVVAVHDREVLAARPVAGARRPHVNRLTEQAAGQPATSRGWATLVRMAQQLDR